MKPIMQSTLGVVSACLLLTSAAMATPYSSPNTRAGQVLPTISNGGAQPISGSPVLLKPQPGTEADRIARQLMARELVKSGQSGDAPAVLTTTVRLGKSHDSDVLFVQIQSPRDCGSAGCDTVSFRYVNSRWVRILDTVSGTIRIAATQHRGMRDLIVQDTDRRIWDGEKYANTVPIPPGDLAPPDVSTNEGRLAAGRRTSLWRPSG
jgi:hypothetical protein